MAYIHEFSVSGLAGSKKNIHQVLDRNLNVFWGTNGAGKTSLLKILHSALRGDTSLLRAVPFTHAEVVFYSEDEDAFIKRSITKPDEDWAADEDDDEFSGARLEPLGDGLWQETPRGSTVRWRTESLSGDDRPIKLNGVYKHTFLPISRMTRSNNGRTYGSNTSRNAAIDDALLDEEFAKQVRSQWQHYNVESSTRIRRIQQQGLAATLAILFNGAHSSDSPEPSSATPQEAYRLVSNFLMGQNIRLRVGPGAFIRQYQEDPKLPGVIATIEKVEADVEEALRPQRNFQTTVENLYSGDKHIVFDRPQIARNSIHVELDGKPIPLQSLSSGEKQLLRLMLGVLAAESGTVMIDEPELSMHVDWQLVLVESMRGINPNCQLLLATHSPEVMANVPDRNVFEL